MSQWSFGGVAFYRMEPAGQPRAWPATLAVSVDVVAGDVSSAIPRRYVDIGGIEHGAWSMRAGCPLQADRDALVAKKYTSATLTTVGGASYTALLTKADPIVHDGGWFYADLTFEVLS
jgi:hypothetical protein